MLREDASGHRELCGLLKVMHRYIQLTRATYVTSERIGLAKVQSVFTFAILAYNLVRIPKLLGTTA